MHEPRISVVIPTKNRTRCLGELVASLRAQTLREWEAIVVDDGSEPAQVEEVRGLLASDPRLVLLRRDADPPGGCHCRNIGARAARAGLVAFFDDDDLLSPACLAARVRAMDEAPDHDFIAFSYERFRERPGDMQRRHDADVSEHALDRFLRLDTPWHTGSVVWRRRFLERIGGWNEQIASWQDWEIGVRALCLKPVRATRPEPRFFVRVASGRHRNMSGAPSPRHVRSWPIALESGLACIRRAGLMDAARAGAFGNLYYFVAERHVEIGDRAEGLRLWSHARDQGFSSGIDWHVRRTLLWLLGARGLHGVMRPALNTLYAASRLLARMRATSSDRAAAPPPQTDGAALAGAPIGSGDQGDAPVVRTSRS